MNKDKIEIKRLLAYLCLNKDYKISIAYITDKCFEQLYESVPRARDFEHYDDKFYYDVNSDLVSFTLRAGGNALGGHFKPTNFILHQAIFCLKEESVKKAKEDILEEMAHIRVNEIISGRGLLIEK